MKTILLERAYPKLIAFLFVIASALSIAVLYLLDIKGIFEPPFLLPLTNTLFTAVIPLLVALYAARAYLRTGSASILLMGCGLLGFGLGAAFAGWLRPAAGGANMNVTVYNSAALMGSLFHISGAFLLSFGNARGPRRGPRLILTSAYGAIALFLTLFAFAALEGVLPPFFVQGRGPTALRQAVLGSAIFFYALSALFFLENYRKTRSGFLYWYALGLALFALGLFAFYIQTGVGSPLGWSGRISNYVGAVFILTAIVQARQTGRSKGLPVEDILAGFFTEAEAGYRSLVEAATDAIVSFDDQGRIILWNAAAQSLFGFTKAEAIGRPFFERFASDEDAAALKRLLADPPAASGAGPAESPTIEVEARRADGSPFPVEISAFARELPAGTVGTCIVRDISERRRAASALQESEERYRSLFNGMTEGFALHEIVLDDSGKPVDYRFIDINPAFEKNTGLDRDRVVGKLVTELLPGIDPHWIETYGRVALTGEPVHFEQYAAPLGRHYEVYAYRPAPGRFAVVFQDVTERRKAQEALRESETKYRNLFANMTEEVHFWELVRNDRGEIVTWRLVDANPPSLFTWGKDLDAIRGKTTDEIFGPGVTEHYMPVVRKIMAEGAPISFEDYFPHLDRYFRFTSIPLGETFITTGVDVSDIRKAQKLAEERQDQLEGANRELESFAYSVSHDLRAPLRAIDGFSKMLLTHMEPKLDRDERRRFEVIRESTAKMGQLIDDLLAFSRLGRQPVSQTRIDMAEVSRQAWDALLPLAPGRNLEIAIGDLPPASGDVPLVRQVFANLVANAVKFTRKREVARIEIGCACIGTENAYYVRDNGAGFDMRYADKLFHVFQRLHADEEFEGNGAGLAIVARIVQRHGGRVWAEGEIDVGATFYFTLPPESEAASR